MSDTGHSSNSQPSNTQKKLVVVISVLVVLVLAAAAVIVFLLTRPAAPESTEPDNDVMSGRGTIVTEDNVDEILNNTEEVPDGHYVTSMSIDWHFDGKESKDAYVENAIENTRTVYFDMYLVSTGEIIYSSPFIPVGAEMKGLTLDKALDPGSYDTILVYHLVDDDEKELSTVSVELKIYVN